MERLETNEYLTSSDLISRLRYIHYRFCIREQFDDFYHDYVVHILEGKGKNQNLEQFTIDWIRGRLGKKGEKAKILNAIVFETHEYEKYADQDIISPEYAYFVKRLVLKYTGRNRVFIILYYIYGLTMLEIGFMFNITQAAVDHCLKRLTDFDNGDHVSEVKNISIMDYEKLEKENRILREKISKLFNKNISKK